MAGAEPPGAGRPAPPGVPQAREPSPRFVASHRGAVLADGGPLLALMNRRDTWHEPVRRWLSSNRHARLVTTWPVLAEVAALLARRIGNDAAIDFLRWVQRGGVAVDTPEDASLAEVLAISERFASLPFDLADASIAEAASRLKIRHVISIDADFDVYRDRAGRPLHNLLLGG